MTSLEFEVPSDPFPVPINMCRNFPHIPPNQFPPGLEGIYSACLKLYPSQTKPLQVTARPKIWLGGTDPLDYISMYSNSGQDMDSPSHWHYVGMGLSDLHGDGRTGVFGPKLPDSECGESGAGFELTFRLKKLPSHDMPPTWPAMMLQALARMVLSSMSQRKVNLGDTIAWDIPLDGESQNLKIRHILLAEDEQLKPISTPLGSVSFIQVVGICEAEKRAAEEWNGLGILNLLRSHRTTGGQLLVTDLHRRESIFQLYPEFRQVVNRGIREEGSNLSGVTALPARCSWNEWIPESDKEGRVSSGKFEHPDSKDASGPLRLNAVEIKLNTEAASYLSVMLYGRLSHGRDFSFTDGKSDGAGITFVPEGTDLLVANKENPYVSKGKHLFVFVSEDLFPRLEEMVGSVKRNEGFSRFWKFLGFKIQVLKA